MLSSHILLSLFLITCTIVDASLVGRSTGKATLRFTTKLNERGPHTVVDVDKARLHAMSRPGYPKNRSMPDVGIMNAVILYTVEVWIGNPATNYSLLIDTGSANTWVGSRKSYVPSKTSRDTGEDFSITYGSGNATGKIWNDTVAFSSSLIVREQGIGVVNSSYGFDDVDGFVGFGPVDLTMDTVRGVDTIPTVTNNLFSQGVIPEESLGIYFVPSAGTTKEGELTFGGYDGSVIAGPVTYVPLTKTLPASLFWGITQSISYGSEVIMQPGNGFVDTGSTFIYIASGAFQKYKEMTGAIYDSATQMLKITAEQYRNLKPLAFNIGDAAYELTANAQIWPRSLNNVIGGTPDGIYLVVCDIGPFNFTGIDFVNGYTFLERFYSVYDTTHEAVGFSKTNYTYAVVN